MQNRLWFILTFIFCFKLKTDLSETPYLILKKICFFKQCFVKKSGCVPRQTQITLKKVVGEKG